MKQEVVRAEGTVPTGEESEKVPKAAVETALSVAAMEAGDPRRLRTRKKPLGTSMQVLSRKRRSHKRKRRASACNYCKRMIRTFC